jgi:hypothetical protein
MTPFEALAVGIGIILASIVIMRAAIHVTKRALGWWWERRGKK